MTKKRRSSFKDKTAVDAKRQRGTQFSYLNLPEGKPQFKEKPGSRIELDFIPYEVTDPNHPDRIDEEEVAVKGTLWYKRPFKVHHNVGAGDQSRTIVCPSSVGQPCPICEYRAKRRQEGASQEEIQKMNYSYRNLYIVIPVNVEEYEKWYKDLEKVPHVWDVAQGNFQKALNEELREDPDTRTFPDLEEGLTLKLRLSEEEIFKTTYAKTSKIQFLEREPYKEDILDDVPNLDEVLRVLPNKEIDALFFSGESPSSERQFEEEDEPEDAPRQRNRRREKEKDEEEGKDKEENHRGKTKKNGCPHGFAFGTDYDKHEECDNCDVWERCEDAKKEGD